MKQILLKKLMASAMLLATYGAFAQTSENFNSRPEADLTQVKGFLQNHCWQIYDFDVNRNGWIPGIEGDGAMVSGPGSSSTENTGIYTPVLSMNGGFQLSFKYKFSGAVSNRRWFKVYLTDASNYVVSLLDSVEVTGDNSNTTYTYDKWLGAGSGPFKLYINYQGSGGNTSISIDQLYISANLYYTGGCNMPPVAVNDIIAGKSDGTATGKVTVNDYDANGDLFGAYLITNSPDGTVTLLTNGNFTFVANAGFTGTSTTFTYNICDQGFAPMCSAPATVTINFPANSTLPVSIIDLKASYVDSKAVIDWTTTFEVNTDHFEIERSTDGSKFETVGTVTAAGNAQVKTKYSYIDNLRSINTNKKDIYYRLKQVDKDMQSTFSKVLIVRIYKTRTVQLISVTPNPVVNNIRVSMDLNETSMVVLKIVNSLGNEVTHKTVKGTAGSNAFEIEGTASLAPGVYFMEVIVNSNERMMVKLVKN